MRIMVTGAAGVLGTDVCRIVAAQKYTPIPVTRDMCDLSSLSSVYQVMKVLRPDAAINCAGRIPERGTSAIEMVIANTMIPAVLSWNCAEAEIPLLHVSTDCVYGLNRAAEFANMSDLYSRSKLAGEPEWGMSVRTSFVNPRHGLWAWLRREAESGKTGVPGWANALWSGSTSQVVAEYLVRDCLELAIRTMPHTPTIDLGTLHPISKLDVLRQIVAHDKLPLKVFETKLPVVDRTLHPVIVLPSFSDALAAFSE